ncbi:phosphoribosylformylglycinamidine (FGAM) synthase-like enzyme [Kutzneria viridogrisea]|uniref:Phosphoribosylformylglycinamidine (FGAM) synthase-like enzyme n=1 Tax=Kutzneria viridogrisea TaxID=47990 RepID=A0ABR6B8Y9_9PSEU|nr:phosphoribosylformylglycinamidine (FGAM) synthase-like enzyme [Kutzneria viridogrisea]
MAYIREALSPIAKQLAQDVDDLVWVYIEAISTDPQVHFQPLAVAAAKAELHKEFSLTVVPGVLSLRIAVDIDTGANWKASLTVTPTVFGFGLTPSSISLSSEQKEITIHPSIAVAGVDLTLGLYGSNLCFGVSGRAWYWAFGKHYKSFDAKDLFCIL